MCPSLTTQRRGDSPSKSNSIGARVAVERDKVPNCVEKYKGRSEVRPALLTCAGLCDMSCFIADFTRAVEAVGSSAATVVRKKDKRASAVPRCQSRPVTFLATGQVPHRLRRDGQRTLDDETHFAPLALQEPP